MTLSYSFWDWHGSNFKRAKENFPDFDQAITALIEDLQPCFNRTHNVAPTPLPAGYFSPTHAAKFPRNIGKMMREADRAENRAGNISTWGLIEQRDSRGEDQ